MYQVLCPVIYKFCLFYPSPDSDRHNVTIPVLGAWNEELILVQDEQFNNDGTQIQIQY